ncbi:MAG: methyltransferase domain-containing protein [Opitutae bacterium]|nr:methyltransferase domain-containing protein [Opitutae bacterium]
MKTAGAVQALRAWRQRQDFAPGPLGWLVNPFYFARRGLRAELAAFLPHLRGEVLDVGCGSKPYAEMVSAARYVGLEIDQPATRARGFADAFYDGTSFPFADGSFDGVLCSQVLEHVFAPEAFVAELRRVLRPGGSLVLAVPFAWDEHEQPRDFARYSSFGLRALLERGGFEIVAQRKSMADLRALTQLASGWLYKATRTSSRSINWLAQLALIAPVNCAGLVLGLLPSHADFYLDNVVLARRRDASP